MTKLESIAISLHDHLWYNMGINDDWPIHVSGDDAEVSELVDLLNKLQEAIKERGYACISYTSK